MTSYDPEKPEIYVYGWNTKQTHEPELFGIVKNSLDAETLIARRREVAGIGYVFFAGGQLWLWEQKKEEETP